MGFYDIIKLIKGGINISLIINLILMTVLFFIKLALTIFILVGSIFTIVWIVKRVKGKNPRKIGLIIPIIVIFFSVVILNYSSNLIMGDFSEKSSSDSVVYNGVTYKTGFYSDDFFIKNIFVLQDIVADDGNGYYTIFDDKYNFLYDGSNSQYEHNTYSLYGGELYIDESQFDEAKSYYDDINNYDYYYEYCWDTVYSSPQRLQIQNMNSDMYNELEQFVEENKNKNDGLAIDMPEINAELSPMFLYKESKDGYFESNIPKDFLVINDKLVMMLYTDANGTMDNKPNGELVYIEVPENLSDYFINLFKENNFEF